MGGSRVSFSGSLCQDSDWIEVLVSIAFQIGSVDGRGGVRKFVFDTDRPAVLKR